MTPCTSEIFDTESPGLSIHVRAVSPWLHRFTVIFFVSCVGRSSMSSSVSSSPLSVSLMSLALMTILPATLVASVPLPSGATLPLTSSTSSSLPSGVERAASVILMVSWELATSPWPPLVHSLLAFTSKVNRAVGSAQLPEARMGSPLMLMLATRQWLASPPCLAAMMSFSTLSDLTNEFCTNSSPVGSTMSTWNCEMAESFFRETVTVRVSPGARSIFDRENVPSAMAATDEPISRPAARILL